jgi:hypothetical protein
VAGFLAMKGFSEMQTKALVCATAKKIGATDEKVGL